MHAVLLAMVASRCVDGSTNHTISYADGSFDSAYCESAFCLEVIYLSLLYLQDTPEQEVSRSHPVDDMIEDGCKTPNVCLRCGMSNCAGDQSSHVSDTMNYTEDRAAV